MSSGIQIHTIPFLRFANGSTLENVRVAYKSINPTSKNGTILIPTCFGGKINSTLSFTTKEASALSKYHVIIAAMLGNGESSSPSNHPDFPSPGQLRYEDVIHAHHHLLTNGLGIQNLEAVIGFSMGGQQAYYWSILYPSFMKKIVVICSSARTSGHNYTFLEGPICALENSKDYFSWKEKKERGDVENLEKPAKATAAFGRAYAAWLTSAEWFDQGLWKKGACDSVEAWIRAKEEGNKEWDADDLLVLARMWQMGYIGSVVQGGQLSQLGGGQGDDGKLKEALESIEAEVLLMPCSHDQYFRPGPNEHDLKYLKRGRLAVIKSVWGHVAGGGGNMEDVLFMDREIGKFLEG